MKHPVDDIQWFPATDLRANAWNPNAVQRQELVLLERSILKTGWIQPVLVSRDLEIIDGFHRWSLARDSKALRKRDGGLVPCAVLDVGPAEARLITVRINRAKGTHVAVRMSELVRELVDDFHLDPQEVADGIGATRAEVDLLYQENVFRALGLQDAPYSRAWVPRESRIHGPSPDREALVPDGGEEEEV